MHPQGLSATWMPFFVFVVVSLCQAPTVLSQCSLPSNETQTVGSSVVVLCTFSPVGNSKLNFTIYGSQGNSTLMCPGSTGLQFGEDAKGYCDVNGNVMRGVWRFSYTTQADNGTYFMCRCSDMTTGYAFLTLLKSKVSFATLVGCVIGGFFGILLVFGGAYVALKRSERFQRCFKGRTPQDEISTIVE